MKHNILHHWRDCQWWRMWRSQQWIHTVCERLNRATVKKIVYGSPKILITGRYASSNSSIRPLLCSSGGLMLQILHKLTLSLRWPHWQNFATYCVFYLFLACHWSRNHCSYSVFSNNMNLTQPNLLIQRLQPYSCLLKPGSLTCLSTGTFPMLSQIQSLNHFSKTIPIQRTQTTSQKTTRDKEISEANPRQGNLQLPSSFKSIFPI